MTLATKLTVTRVVSSPLFMVLFFMDGDYQYDNNPLILKFLTLLLAIAFSVLDGTDGFFARKRNEISNLGKLLDPYADKISNITVFLCFLASGYAQVWMVLIIVYRDFTISTLRTICAAENIILAARKSGKQKTVFQAVAIITILSLSFLLDIVRLIHVPTHSFLTQYWSLTANFFMFLTCFVTGFSIIDYLIANKQLLKKYFK